MTLNAAKFFEFLTNESQWDREIFRHSPADLGRLFECLVKARELGALLLNGFLVHLLLRGTAAILLLLQDVTVKLVIIN